MRQIQWFPGHMTKAMRMMEEEVKLVDGIIYVLDARASFACLNKKLNDIFSNRPIVYVLNKTDLISLDDKSKIIKEFTANGETVVAVNGTDKKDCGKIIDAMLDKLSDKIERSKTKGINKTLRVMVAGIPNTGKSTIINSISGNKRAVTGDKAGVTKNKQWIRLNGLELLDTPGTMPPSFENQTYAKHLAYIGSINDDILDVEELCLELIKDLIRLNPDTLKSVYKLVDTDKEPIEMYNDICKNRGYLLRGGNYDYARCSKAVIDDFRKGKLGKICLERNRID